jgi:hypothetical protein
MTSEEMVAHLRTRYRELARAHPRAKRLSESDYLVRHLPGMLLDPKWRRRRYSGPRPRRVNPRGGRLDRCLGEVKRGGKAKNPYAVCKAALKKKRTRRRNPRERMYILVAVKGPDKLQYLGGHKFSKHGRPALFPTRDGAITLGTFLSSMYPVLRTWRFTTVET